MSKSVKSGSESTLSKSKSMSGKWPLNWWWLESFQCLEVGPEVQECCKRGGEG